MCRQNNKKFHNLKFFRVKQQDQGDHLSAWLSYSAVRSRAEKIQEQQFIAIIRIVSRGRYIKE